MTGRRVFLVAGERSGDRHGAALIHALSEIDPAIAVCGLGGPEMRAAGGDGIEDWVEEAGVVGLVEVLRNYGYFRRKFGEALRRIETLAPDAVVFIDYPGFNLRLADALARRGSRSRRIYFISPQVWAWNRRRIPRMAKILDRMLCIFPFEKPLYEDSGLPTEFVGHPLIDQLAGDGGAVGVGAPGDDGRDRGLVGLFPGSREREVSKLFPVLVEAGRIVKERVPGTSLVASAASERLHGLMREIRARAGMPDDACPIVVGNSRGLMRRCWAGAVASGTATLEAAVLGLPYCLVYRVAWPTYWVGRRVIRIEHLGMANILAGREIVREFVQERAEADAVAAEVAELVGSDDRRARMRQDFAEVRGVLGSPGAHRRAALAVWHEIEPSDGDRES